MDVTSLIDQLSSDSDEKVNKAAESLSHIGSKEAVNGLIKLLGQLDVDFSIKIIVARTLGSIENNGAALDPLLQAIEENPSIAGDLLVSLNGFDVSDKYITIFKYSLSNSFKTSSVAEDLLNHKEFNITPRVLKKVTKAWNHYENNIKHDDAFELKKQEVEGMLEGLQDHLEEENINPGIAEN